MSVTVEVKTEAERAAEIELFESLLETLIDGDLPLAIENVEGIIEVLKRRKNYERRYDRNFKK